MPAGWLERHGILSHLQAIENGAFDRVEWTFDKDEEDAADVKDAVAAAEANAIAAARVEARGKNILHSGCPG